jgi:FlaA1/EpsC-like NDP-sugar epimerase
MNEILKLIGRERELFINDVDSHERQLSESVRDSRFLVLGGAGSIGQAVTKEIFKRNPAKLHVVDISENNLVELVRDIRSSFGYISGEFRTFALDIGSIEYDAFFKADGDYDYILNLSALKHVRSEKDPYTLMRMVDVNVFNTDKTLQQAVSAGAKKILLCFYRQSGKPCEYDGGLQTHYGDVPDAQKPANRYLYSPLRQRRLLRRLAAARLQPASGKTAADCGPE